MGGLGKGREWNGIYFPVAIPFFVSKLPNRRIDEISFKDPFHSFLRRWRVINYQFSQKLKLLENCEFNHLTIILTLLITCGFKLPLNKWGPTCGIFNILNER